MTESIDRAFVARSRRGVRSCEVDARAVGALADGIVQLYDGSQDVIVVRGAFDAVRLAAVGARLDDGAASHEWQRPNEAMPVEDVQLLGTDAPATPTYSAPRGVAFEAYLTGASAHAPRAAAAFGPGFDAVAAIADVLGRFAGGRPVQLARAHDGRPYAPYTIRRMADGKQIGVHHDYHYRLDLYRELSPRLDLGTLVSFVAALRTPQSGGELVVYGATSDDADVPRLPNGFAYDAAAIEARYDRVAVTLTPGDLFLLAAGRCLHRVSRVAGSRARITMGGFLALTRERDCVLFWS